MLQGVERFDRLKSASRGCVREMLESVAWYLRGLLIRLSWVQAPRPSRDIPCVQRVPVQGVRPTTSPITRSGGPHRDLNDKGGIYVPRDVGMFNILVIPGVVASHISDDNAAAGYAAAEVLTRALRIVDIPQGNDEVLEVKDWVDYCHIRDHNAGVFVPRIRNVDPLNDGRLRSFGARGDGSQDLCLHRGERACGKRRLALKPCCATREASTCLPLLRSLVKSTQW
jgi:hypothetical protein